MEAPSFGGRVDFRAIIAPTPLPLNRAVKIQLANLLHPIAQRVAASQKAPEARQISAHRQT